MINFKTVDITSFKGIFHCKLDFTEMQNKLYSLEGINNTVDFASSNGAGKSTLASALLFALYGSTDDSSIKKADYQNKNSKIGLKIVVELEIQGVDYTIERTEKSFKLYKGGEDISELTNTDTEKKFQYILGLTKAEFCSFTYLSQNGSGSFLTKTPYEKLSCIKDFIFGEDLLSIEGKLKDLYANLRKNIQDSEVSIAQERGSLNTLKSLLEAEQNAPTKESESVEVVSFPYTLEEYEAQLKDYEAKQREIELAYKDLIKTKSENEGKFRKLQWEMNSLKEQYSKVKNSICPTCGQHLPDSGVKDKIASESKRIKEEAIPIKEAIANASKAIDLLDADSKIKVYQAKIKSIISAISALKQQEKQKREQERKIHIDVDKIEKEIATIEERIESNQKTKDEFEFRLNQVSKLQTYFKTEFIQHIQQAFLTEIENYLNLYCYEVFDDDFRLNFSKNSLELTIGGKPYSYFSGGEKERIDFIFVFAIKIALMHLTDKCTNIFIADESLRGQDSQAFEGCIELIDSLTSSEGLVTILISHRDVDYNKNKIIIEKFYDKTKLQIIEV